MWRFIRRLFVSLLLFSTVSWAQSPFSQDSAYAYLRVLAGDIGPRTMGSPAERAAMEFAVQKFREFGLDEAYIMPIREASNAGLQGGVNTNSGIAVGVLRGRTDRVIVIGGHIDSAGPENPGANDDGSGSACVIELARVLKLRNNEGTTGRDNEGTMGRNNEGTTGRDNEGTMGRDNEGTMGRDNEGTMGRDNEGAMGRNNEGAMGRDNEGAMGRGNERNNEATVVFALFGGEEQGLVGSKYFVKYFDRIEDVDLMLQIDMANGSEWLLPLTEAGEVSSPEWLVRAAYEEFSALGYTGLSYPTHFYTFMHLIPGGGIGSDHQPFLERGIPAIDFTSDVTDPIHTPQDNLDNFIAGGLKRSGDLVYNLFVRFDAGTPEERTGSYYLIQLGSILLFFPTIVLWIFLFIAVSLSIVALLEIRKRRVPEEPKRKIPGLKLFLLAMIIQTCVWTSENLVGLISGRRFPWVADPDGYFVLGLLAGIFGIWVGILAGRRLDMSTVAYRYALRSSVFLLVFILLLSLVSVKLALYPATALALLALSFLVRLRFVRLILWLFSGHFMFRLIFSEGFYLFARTTSQLPAEGAAPLFLHVFYILFFSLWSFPFLLAFAAIWWDSPSDMQWLSAFGRPFGGIVSAGAVLACAFYLSTRPAYSNLWNQIVTVRQSITSGATQGIVTVTSPDYLDGAVVSVAGRDTTLRGRITTAGLSEFDAGDYDWIKTERTVETRKDSMTTFSIGLRIISRTRPYSVSVTYAGGKGAPENVATPLLWSQGSNSITFRWYSFPDTSLYVPVTFSLSGSDTVREYVEAVFLEEPVPVQMAREHTAVLRRTVLERTAVLSHQE